MHFPTRFSLALPGHGIQKAAREFVDKKVADPWTVTAELGRLGACARQEAPRGERTRDGVAAALVEEVLVDFKSSTSAAAHAHATEGVALLQRHCAAKGTRITARHVKLLGAAVAQAKGDIANFPRAVRAALGKEPSLPALVRKAPATPPQRSPARPLPTLGRLQAPAGPVKTPAPAKPVRLVTVRARDPQQHERLLQRRREMAEAAQAAQLAVREPQ